MKRLLFSLALGSSLAGNASAATVTLGAVLTGAQEVPPTNSTGFGNATVIIDGTRTVLTVNLNVSSLGSSIIGAHIHEQNAGSVPGQDTGPVVVNVLGAGSFQNNILTATIPIDATLGARLANNPQNFYVNVHTNQFPNGAIRGQLANATGPITYSADLRSSNEVPPTGTSAYGSAFVTIDPGTSTLTWEVNTHGIASPTLAHIHKGMAGANGPVLINFATSASDIPGGRTKGTVSIASLDAATLLDLEANPAGYYVNVHSAAFPGGEIRGQLTSANESEVAVAGKVTNGSGQNFVTDVRIFNPSYSDTANALVEYFASGTSANTNATASIATSIPARGTTVFDDINGSAFLNTPGTIGGLRITSASPIAVTSRIYNDQRTQGKGTFGQFVPSVLRPNALRRGVIPQLSNTALDAVNPSGYRTNIGFFNPNNSTVAVRLELRDPAGTLLGSATLQLAAYSQQQSSIANYFNGLDLSAKTNLTLSFDAGAPIVGYASVVDNVSSDQIFVQAQSDVGVATQ